MQHPSYWNVLLTFMRNSLIRDMTFRSNFLILCVSSMSWTVMNFGFYLLIYQFTAKIAPNPAWGSWGKYEFFVFLSTTWFINSLVQAFFMPNCQEFSELIRTGNLDFALLKPIDTQFLISLQKVEWSALTNFFLGFGLLAFSLWKMTYRVENPLQWQPIAVVLYPLFVVCGVGILYSLMISLAATSIWFGRNQSLYNFWFYITNFSRYPMEIYDVGWGIALRKLFTFIIPVLVVVNVPARLLAAPLQPRANWEWAYIGFTLLATIACLWVSRWIFTHSLLRYRSASS